jgi:hypothetical protein
VFTMSFVARRVATALAGLSLMTVLAPAAVVGGAPPPPARNPAPPDFYTCGPVGAGTICRALTDEAYGPDATGIFCDGVELLDAGGRTVAATRWYDADGNLVRRERIFDFNGTHLINPATGATLSYKQHNTDWEDFTIPGDLDSAVWHGHGVMSVTAPGFGQVLLGAGVAVVGPDGSLLHTGGPDELGDYYATGDSSIVADLCAALGG